MFPRKWMMPAMKSDLGSLDVFSEGADHDVIRLTDDDQKLEVSLDTSQYKPEELHVQVKNNAVVIEGSHDDKTKDGKGHLTRRFTRFYTLPKVLKLKMLLLTCLLMVCWLFTVQSIFRTILALCFNLCFYLNK